MQCLMLTREQTFMFAAALAGLTLPISMPIFLAMGLLFIGISFALQKYKWMFLWSVVLAIILVGGTLRRGSV